VLQTTNFTQNSGNYLKNYTVQKAVKLRMSAQFTVKQFIWAARSRSEQIKESDHAKNLAECGLQLEPSDGAAKLQVTQ